MAILGAVLGDILGAQYEFNRPKDLDWKNVPLIGKHGVRFTDDSVMALAIKKALDEDLDLVETMVNIGRHYPFCGYGGNFYHWIHEENHAPYNSWGNGSAMRVAYVGEFYDDYEMMQKMAAKTAEVSHNHPEGIKGAEAIASVIWLSRNGKSKEEIKNYVEKEFEYDLSRTCDEIRPNYRHVESCQKTCPEAITAFLEGESFEDVIRTAVSLGGDCDTLTDISTAMAEAFYGIPDDLKNKVLEFTTEDMHKVLKRFDAAVKKI